VKSSSGAFHPATLKWESEKILKLKFFDGI
jgi:hypothetical protein